MLVTPSPTAASGTKIMKKIVQQRTETSVLVHVAFKQKFLGRGDKSMESKFSLNEKLKSS